MLWQLSISTDSQAKRIVPIFINDSMILRPVAGSRIWDALLDSKMHITILEADIVEERTVGALKKMSEDYAYDTFLKIKTQYEKKYEETYRKHLYALKIRLEAAEKIGIANIKKHKISSLSKEKEEVARKYSIDKQIYPEFKLVFMACMERVDD